MSILNLDFSLRSTCLHRMLTDIYYDYDMSVTNRGSGWNLTISR